MNSLPDMRRLLGFSEFRQQRHEQTLQRTQRQLQPLLEQQSSLDEHEASLQNLLASHRAQSCVMDHGQLLTLLRRQAVIRRQIHLVRLERDRVEQQCVELHRTLHEQREQLRFLQRKHGKYQQSFEQLSRTHRLEAVHREEREIEDMMGVRR
jgi:chromosome segregation ATPase